MIAKGESSCRQLRRLAVGLAAAWSAAAALSARAADDPPQVAAELRARAVETIRAVFNGQQQFVKVHAAEYLLELDYPEGVRETFEQELARHGSEPKYRVVIWRVLARAANNKEQRKEWLDKIRAVAFDRDAPDRTHAVETLAKLGYKLRDDELAAMEQAAQLENHTLAPYAAWVLANCERPGSDARLADLLDSPEVDVRCCAAYALRHLGSISAPAREKLLSAARGEPAASKARAMILGAAAVHAPPDQRAALKDRMGDFAAQGDVGNRVEACHVLAEIGDAADLPLLTRLLDDPSPDLRAAAADAVLRIARRAPHHLLAWDWAVIALYALGMLAVGWYYARRTKTQEQYLLGDRRMNPWMVGVSLFASLFSCITYLAIPGEVVKYGPMIICDILAFPLMGLLIGWLIIPFIMKLKVSSAYEILELRFGPAVRTLGSLLFLSLRLAWMSVIVYAMSAKVLVPLAGLPAWTIPWMCALLAFVTIVYTAIGGLRAVVVTDVLQAVILFGAAIATVITITVCLGGVHAWWPSHWPAHWPEPQLYDPNARFPILVLMLSSVTWYVCTSASDQIAVQRYLSTKDAKAARKVVFISLLANALVVLLLATVALALLAYFQAYPHLLRDGQTMLADADKLFPQFIIIGLPVGLSGLVVAGLLACAMSAFSAGINSTCSVLTVDVIDRLRGKRKTADAKRVGQLKHVSYLIGVIVVCLSLFVNMVQGNLVDICYKVNNLLVAPLGALFLLAMFVPWARAFGVMVGAASGVAVAVAVCYWQEITGTPGISFIWVLPSSLLAAVGVGALVSLLPIGRPPTPLDTIM